VQIAGYLLIIGLCFLTLEIGARVLAYVQGIPQQDLRFDWQRTLYIPHPYIGYSLRPNYYRSPYKDGDLHINALGYRGAEITRQKPVRTIRLVCLGGSTTFSIDVGDRTTYPQRLEDLLRATYPDYAIEVINAGVGAYTSAESLANLVFRVFDLQPDVIVVYHAVNDVHPRVIPGFQADYSHYRKALALPAPGLVDVLSRGSTLVSLLRHTFAEFHIRHLTTRRRMEDIPKAEQLKNLRATDASAFRRNLQTMIELARARHVEVVLSTFVYNEEHLRRSRHLSFAAYAEGIAQHNDVMLELRLAYGCVLADLAALFPRHERTLFDDPVHLLSAGTAIQARIFHDAIVASRLLERIATRRSLGSDVSVLNAETKP
jgi:lysophospholipase L1-like esterase